MCDPFTYFFGLSSWLKQKLSLFTQLCITEETLMILPRMPVLAAVSTIFSSSFSVKKWWPAKENN